jgi:hypothetical protein
VRTFRNTNTRHPQFELSNLDQELKNNPATTLQLRPVAMEPASIFMTNVSLVESQATVVQPSQK